MDSTPVNPCWERRGRPLKDDEAMLERVNLRLPREMVAKLEEMAEIRRRNTKRQHYKSDIIRELLVVALERCKNNGL